MKVREIMSQHPICCYPQDTGQMVVSTLRDQDIGSVPAIANHESQQPGPGDSTAARCVTSSESGSG